MYDANVLYPSFLRDVLMRLALTDLFRARWSEDIHREWMEAVLRDKPELKDKLELTRSLMDKNVRDCLVTGYQALIAGLNLPDPDDRHVLAAAIKAQAGLIITWNQKDFPAEALDQYGIKTQGPDDFIIDLLELNEQVVVSMLEKHRQLLQRPALSRDDYCLHFNRQRLVKTEARLRSIWGLD